MFKGQDISTQLSKAGDRGLGAFPSYDPSRGHRPTHPVSRFLPHCGQTVRLSEKLGVMVMFTESENREGPTQHPACSHHCSAVGTGVWREVVFSTLHTNL